MAENTRRWCIVATMALPLFLLSIDFYGIAVALPSIGGDLHAGTTELQWTLSAFNLAVAAPLIALGRLGDILGRRRIMLAGIVLFALGSALCGGAPNMAVLIAGRCVQGLAVALFSTSPLSIVSSAFPAEERALVFAVWTAVGACGSALGPLVGGLLTELLSWRWLFFVNLPVVVVAAALILTIVPESRDETAEGRFDLAGIVTITGGLAALVFGLQLGDDWGWTSRPVAAGLIAGAMLIAAFVAIEARQGAPLVDLGLFRHRDFLTAQLVAVTGNFGFAAVIFFSTLYLQNVLELAPLRAGLVLVAFSACFVLTLPVAGSLMRQLGNRRSMRVGMVLMVLALLLFGLIAPGEGLAWLIAALLVAGVGQSFAFNASTTAAMNAVPDAQAGAASGILNGARQVGSALGIAVTGAVFQTVESGELVGSLRPHLSLTPEQETLVRGLLSGSRSARGTLASLAPQAAIQIDAIVWSAFTTALHAGMLLCAVVSALGIIVTLGPGGGSAVGRAVLGRQAA